MKVLLCQISTRLLEKYDSRLQGYYDLIWKNRQEFGFRRPAHFWEIPNWIAIIKKNIPDADFKVVDDVEKFIGFLNGSTYTHICFSVMEINKEMIKSIILQYTGTGRFVLGGYIDFSYFSGHKNVDIYGSISEFIGAGYEDGYDYSHFKGEGCIPRLTMSTGCKNKCGFCTEGGKFQEVAIDEVERQADSFSGLNFRLVYLNDKTFGQADNHVALPEIYRRIKASHPEFDGFVVQTTSTQWLRMSERFIVDSHIRFVEIGVETFNDDILGKYKKPSSERAILQATEKTRCLPVWLLPNIVVGFPEETDMTYRRTLEYLHRNRDCMSFLNICILSIYHNTEISSRMEAEGSNDYSEGVLEKSFLRGREEHVVFLRDLLALGTEILQGEPTRGRLT